MKTVSFSQFSIYKQCPRKWKLDYLENKRVFEQTIHTCFGSAFHTTVQQYLEIVYNKTANAANKMDLPGLLKESMFSEYKNALEKNGNKHFSTPTELAEFHQDGAIILDYLKKHRRKFFPSKGCKLIGIEKPLRLNLTDHIAFIGFLDIVVYDKDLDIIKIYDIKTSGTGWSKYQKADPGKYAQLVLYKEFYSKQFNHPVDNIEIEFVIVRRKINQEAEFVPKRIQSFIPPSGKITRNKVLKMFTDFLSNCYTDDGEYNQNGLYPAHKSPLCPYCLYNNDDVSCPKKERIGKDQRDE